MKTIKVEFSVSTRYVGSRTSDIVEIEVPKDIKDDDLDDYIKPFFEEWIWESIDGYWSIQE